MLPSKTLIDRFYFMLTHRSKLLLLLFLAVVFLVIIIFYRRLYSRPPDQPITSVQVQTQHTEIYSGIPRSYAQCLQIEKKYRVDQELEPLKCVYHIDGGMTGETLTVDEKEKLKLCTNMGGIPRTYTVNCALTFYNPAYTFPQTFSECVRDKKGEFTKSVEPRCMIHITLVGTYNKTETTALIEACRRRGGDYDKNQLSCFLNFIQ